MAECPACLSRDLKPHLKGWDFHYGASGTFETDRCSSCGLVLLNPMPSASDLSSFYPDDYYSYQAPVPPSGLKHRIKKWLGLVHETSLPSFRRPGRMLDIGCGAGEYLVAMRERGWEVHGAELSKSAAECGRAHGLDIRGGELPEAGFEAGSFDFVRSNHSFEHIPNPDTVLQEISRILKPDGQLFIGVPNANGTWARLFGRYWWYFGLPVHTFGYTPKGLEIMLKRHGFAVKRVIYNSSFAGLQGSLQIWANRNRRPLRSDGRIFDSWLLRVPAHYLARLLDLAKRGDCIEIIAVKE